MDSDRPLWLGVLAGSLRLLADWFRGIYAASPLARRLGGPLTQLARAFAAWARDAAWPVLRRTGARVRPAAAAAAEAVRPALGKMRRGTGAGFRRSLAPIGAALGAVLGWKIVVVGGLTAAGVTLGLYANCGLDGCPDVRGLSAYQPGGAPVLLDRSGVRFADLAPFERVVVSIDSLPEHVAEAFVAVEDRRFFSHDGVDWRRVAGAALANVRVWGVSEGSSTISMQLARNVFPEDLPGTERTFRRKLQEMRVAKLIEHRFEKREILEMYLNHIYFGGGAYGIEAASRLYFGKPAAELDLSEAAALAALPKAPSHYDPRRQPERSVARRDLIVTLMEQQGLVTAEEAEEARDAELDVRDGGRNRESVPLGAYYIDVVRGMLEERFGESLYRSRLRIHTTLDATAQRAAEEELEAQLASVEDRVRDGEGPLQGAMVVVEAATGEVLAMVGGRDPTTTRYNRAILGRRQLGSAFKPFVFAAALQEGVPTSRVLLDLPLTMRISRTDVWAPSNYDGRFEGEISLREALVRSRNIPTVRLASEVGIPDVANAARAAGILEAMDETPSLALGTVALSPLQLATAYTTFATLGQTATEPLFVLRVEDEEGTVLWEAERQAPHEGMDPRVAYVMTDILRDAVDRGTGTGVRAAGFTGPVAGKTGTTNDATDAWFVGYTPDLVATVWIGYDQPSSLGSGATGGGFAAPVWGRVMRRLYREREMPQPWRQPGGIEERTVDSSSGYVLQEGCQSRGGTTRSELFLAESVPPSTCPYRSFWSDIWERVRGTVRSSPRQDRVYDGPIYPRPVEPRRGRGRPRGGD